LLIAAATKLEVHTTVCGKYLQLQFDDMLSNVKASYMLYHMQT